MFSSKHDSHAHRPMSVATEFVDTDWDEEIVSDVEDNSPRVSLQSVRVHLFRRLVPSEAHHPSRGSRVSRLYPHTMKFRLPGQVVTARNSSSCLQNKSKAPEDLTSFAPRLTSPCLKRGSF